MRTTRLRNLLVGYGVAILTPVLGSAMKLALSYWTTRDTPFLLYAIAVLIAARVGGLGPGIAATILSALANDFLFMRPFNSMVIGAEQLWQLALFLFEGFAISWLCAKLNSARQAAESSELEARQLERRMFEISDAEQRRIGHDLHDGLSQHLMGIALVSKKLSRRLNDHPELVAEAEKVSQLANTAVAWTHDLSRSLTPPALESQGLAEGLRELATNAESLFGIECVVTVGAGGDAVNCSTSAAVHLYRIAQEAVSNAVKHGQAKRVDIRLEQQANRLHLVIRDNGSAVTSGKQSNPTHSGMGLNIMKHRANMIGARFHFQQLIPVGAEVTCDYDSGSEDHEHVHRTR